MDPDANLREQRQLAAEIIKLWDDASPDADHERLLASHAERLAELIQALDQWIVGGGFLPAAWRTTGGRRGR